MKYLIPVLTGGATIAAAVTTALAVARGAFTGHVRLTPYLYGYGAAVALLLIAASMAVRAAKQETPSPQRYSGQIGSATTDRPRLVVRKVFLRDGTAIPTIGVPDAYPWMVDYAIANIGGSRATIKCSGFEFTTFENGVPARLPYKMQEPAEPLCIDPGEEKEFSVDIGQNLTNLFRILGLRGEHMSHQKIGHAYFWGRAQYADDRGTIRNVAVCRHYETGSGKFKAIDDPDYEYAD
jgi:hypothetical protein